MIVRLKTNIKKKNSKTIFINRQNNLYLEQHQQQLRRQQQQQLGEQQLAEQQQGEQQQQLPQPRDRQR